MSSVNHTDPTVLSTIANRWSPYRYSDRQVEDAALSTCFEAARWAASSYNDQPWYWIVFRKEEQGFESLVRCLMEANQPWAQKSPILILSVLRTSFAHNGQPNRVAAHDLGQATAFLSLQACELGLQVHQMGGINLSAARQSFQIPEGFEPYTAIALGYPREAPAESEQDKLLEKREMASRQRRPLSKTVFINAWGQPSENF